MKKNTNLNLNINRDDSDLNDFMICWEHFESRPNKIIIHNTYSTKLFYEVVIKYIKEKTTLTEIIPSGGDDFIINDKMFVKIDDETFMSYVIVDRDCENSVVSEVSIFYKQEDLSNGAPEFVKSLIEELNDCIVDFFNEEENSKLNTITYSTEGLEIDTIEITKQEKYDIYYSKKTFKEVNKLIKDIKKSNKGLSILYGERGTGKTSVINYLVSNIDRMIIFIPNSMIEHTINNPDFRKFLKRFDKPIIVIDDCEMLLNEVFNKSNLFVNNLVQIIDGFLSDSMEVNVISIFNVDNDSEIDHSLLECNNLLRVIKFEELSLNESTKLSEHLGFNKDYKNKTRVLDIIRNKKNKETHEIGL